MILTGAEIVKCVESGEIKISDFDASRIGPNSYDLRLSDTILVYRDSVLDAAKENPVSEIRIPGDGLVLMPGELYLGRTEEWTDSGTYIPMLEGRSSIGRLGLFVHVTAGFGDRFFKGCWTLELTPVKPLRIYAGMRVCQIYYYQCNGNPGDRYDGKYQGSKKVMSSRMHVENSEWRRCVESKSESK